MAIKDWLRRGTDARAVEAAQTVETRSRPADLIKQSSPDFMRFFGMTENAAGQVVNMETALQVPAVWAAVGFLSRTLASLPVKSYQTNEEGARAEVKDPISALFNYAANDELNAYAFRQKFWQDLFTYGRALAFIDRNGKGEPVNLWPIDVTKATISRKGGRLVYTYAGENYRAGDILDLVFMPKADGLGAVSPILANADTIGLALAVTSYGGRFFNNGGIPPFTISGPIRTAAGATRAADDLAAAVREMASAGRNAVALPEGHTISALGIDPEKMQMVDTQRFLIEQIARIYGLPPVFVGDLTHGTFSNTEQQDLHLVKHLVAQWARAFEREANLKVFGRNPGGRFLEMSLDALMRGDFKTRADGLAQKINTGQLTPNEARALDNREPKPGGDFLYLQGAMVPAANLSQPKGGNDE